MSCATQEQTTMSTTRKKKKKLVNDVHDRCDFHLKTMTCATWAISKRDDGGLEQKSRLPFYWQAARGKQASKPSQTVLRVLNMAREMNTVLVIGAGNGGKTTAADLALQGKAVHLFELPKYASNLESVQQNDGVLESTGAVQGTAKLSLVTDDLESSMSGVDTIFVCTVVQAHADVAKALAPFVTADHVVVLNPGSTGGALEFARVWRHDCGLKQLPVLVEFGTLTYGCRAAGAHVKVSVKVKNVSYGVLPTSAMDAVGPALEKVYPGLSRSPSVLAAGLCNANPIIHPAITLLNLGRMEQQGSAMLFYKDGVSPMVANLIQALDEERMSLLRALGYPAVSDAENSVIQGYADSADSYYECYGKGSAYATFASPDGDLSQHRYFHEDCGRGLVLYMSMGAALGVPTPVSEAVVRIASVVAKVDFIGEQQRTVRTLGLEGMTLEQMKAYLQTGVPPN